MKQKAVIKVAIKDTKYCRSKALKVIVGAQGVEFVGWKERDGNEIVVVGDGLDMVKLVESVRKKVGPTEVVSITPVKPDSGGGGAGARNRIAVAGAPTFVLPLYEDMQRSGLYSI